jgi:hypothetical protein
LTTAMPQTTQIFLPIMRKLQTNASFHIHQ